MKVLLFGSSGQIGTNLALALQKAGHGVLGVDKRPNTWTDDIETLVQDLSLPSSDFSKGIGGVEYPADFDIVVHFAAHAKVYELVEHPARALENITMTFNVLEFCRHHNLPLIFSSSREVYGNIFQETTAETQANFAVAESPYSASKISGEALIYSYAHCYNLRYLVFRFSNVYGRYDNDLERMERVIPLFINKIKNHEPITIYGADKVLDFTYIDDCVRGVYKGLELLVNTDGGNHTLNLAYGQGNSLLDLAEYIGQALDITPSLTIKPSRVGEVTHYVADISQAQAILGYNPTTTLRAGIHKTCGR